MAVMSAFGQAAIYKSPQKSAKTSKSTKKMSYWDSLKNASTHFLLSSTIHGLRYWHEGRNLFEKLAWFLAVMSCFGFASYLIKTNLDEAMDDPILTTLHTTSGRN